jgi:tetratricopeptide (TPR) repeat protein
MTNEEGYPKAKQAVLKAIELDQSLGEAYSTLGLIKIVFDRDIYGPEQEFQKAIKFSPNSAEVYSSYAQYLRWLGRYDEGAIIAKRAIELDPLTPLTKFWLGAIYFYAGRYDESIDYFKKMLTLDSNYVHTYSYLAYNYTLKGSYSNAIYYADKALSFEEIRNSPLYLSPLGWVYAKAGEINKAKEILTRVEELRINMNSDLISVALIYVGLGEREKAFDLLFKAYEVHSSQTIYMKVMGDCWFKEIRSDPRYVELLKKIGFKDD